jgi:hypothetical protein
MSDKKNIIEVLLEGTDYTINDSQKEKLTTLLNEAVEARVTAKEKLLLEEFEAKEKTLKASLEEERAKLLKESEENEIALLEEAEAHKKRIEETVLSKVGEFRSKIEESANKSFSDMKAEFEAVLMEEAKEWKAKKDATLVEEVKLFKESMIQKVSDYLEAKFEKAIPGEVLESAAKLQVYEPLVKSLMESFAQNYIKLDDSSYMLIKESKETITRLEAELQSAKKEGISIAKQKREVERDLKISRLTEGLLENQKAKARKLLEGFDYEEVESQFNKIRDIIVESDIRKPVVAPKAQQVVPMNEGEKKTVPAKVEKPEQETVAVQMQMKKVLKESEEKKPEVTKKTEVLNESASPINAWAGKVAPRYSKG